LFRIRSYSSDGFVVNIVIIVVNIVNIIVHHVFVAMIGATPVALERSPSAWRDLGMVF